jgi:hypothetical protein
LCGIKPPERPMALTLRPTGLSSPTYADQLDYTIHDDGQPLGGRSHMAVKTFQLGANDRKRLVLQESE